MQMNAIIFNNYDIHYRNSIIVIINWLYNLI